MENVETQNPLKVVQRDCYNPNSFLLKKLEFLKGLSGSMVHFQYSANIVQDVDLDLVR
jgi:hypothetical protein